MSRPYPYYPAKASTGKLAGTEKLVELCGRRWKTKNLGTWVVRDMRGKPGQLSVHATGAAADIGYPDRKTGEAMWDWFLAHTLELGICEIHDYSFGKYGRGYRCSRGEGAKGVKVYANEAESAGSGGAWLHLELSPEMAADPVKFETAWRSLPKP